MVAGEDDSAQGDSEATDSDDESELSEEDLQGLTIAEKEERLSWEEATVKSLRNEARAHSKEVQRTKTAVSHAFLDVTRISKERLRCCALARNDRMVDMIRLSMKERLQRNLKGK